MSLLLNLMFKNMYIGEKNASHPYQVGHNKIGNCFVIYCTSGDTLKCVVKLTFGIYSSCLHSMTKERACEEERSQMNEARNGKLPLVQGAQMRVVCICIRSLWLLGAQTQKALKVLLSSSSSHLDPGKSIWYKGLFVCCQVGAATHRRAKKVK